MPASRRDSVTTTTSGTSITPNLPTSADGDVLLMAVSGYSPLGTPSGGNQTWTQITTETRAGPFGADIAMATYWAVRGATAPTAPSVSNGASDQINAIVMAVQAADTTTPIDAAIDVNGVTTGFAINAASVSPAGSDSLLVVFFHAAPNSGPGTWSTPTGMTEHHDFGGWDWDSCNTQALTASGATGVRESTPSVGCHWIAATIAVKSASTGNATVTPGVIAATAAIPSSTASGNIQRLAPDAVLASTNLTGATVANLDDDPDAPEADWATATSNNVATDARVSFPTPTGTLATGAGLQEFRALVRKQGGTGTPTARLELWEAGALVSAGTENNVTSGTGQVIALTWDATGRTAASIEAKVVGTQTGGAGGVRASVDVGAVEWNATTSVSTPATATPATIATTAALPAATAQAGSNATPTPAAVAATSALPAASTATGATLTPPPVAAVASLPAPTAGGPGGTVTASHLTDGVGTGASSQATASISPGADRMVVLHLGMTRSGSLPPDDVTVTGCGLTWTATATVTYTSRRRAYVFQASGASPTTGALTMTSASGGVQEWQWSVDEFPGSGSIANAVTSEASAATSRTATIGSAGSAGDATVVMGVFETSDAIANITTEAGWVDLAAHEATNVRRQKVSWDTDRDTTPTYTWTTSAGVALIAYRAVASGASGDATATPAAVAVPAALPAPTVQTGGNATAAPSPVAGVAALPAPTPAAASTVAPAAIPVVVAIGTLEVEQDWTADPAATPAVAALPAATPQTGSGATPTPATVAAVVSLPAPSPAAASTVAPAAVPATTSMPASTRSTGATAAPATVPTTAALSAPTTAAGATATPDPTPATVALPAATADAQGNASRSPVTVAATTAAPAPTVSASSTASPAPTPAAAALPAPSVSSGATTNPAPVPAVAATPAASASAGATTAPDPVAAQAALPPATVEGQGNATAAPATTTATAAVPPATTAAGATASPAPLATTAALPVATTETGATATPDAIPAPVAVPTPSVQAAGNTTANPAVIPAVAALPPSTPAAGATVAPLTIAAVVSSPSATAAVHGTGAPATLAVTVALPAASTATGSGVTVTPSVVAVTTGANTPTVSAASVVGPALLGLVVGLPAATVVTLGNATWVSFEGAPAVSSLDEGRTTVTVWEGGS